MPSMNVVFTQILVILLYILIGYAAGKLRLINADQRKYLTTICTNLILPFTILSASNQTISHNQMAELGLSFLLMLGLFIATTTIAMLVQRHTPRPLKVTTTSLVTYPNCTFLGLPLCRALFGDIAILYNAVAMVAFNVLFFTWQSSAFTGKSFRPRNLATPGTIATALLLLMLFAGIQFPAPVQTRGFQHRGDDHAPVPDHHRCHDVGKQACADLEGAARLCHYPGQKPDSPPRRTADPDNASR